MFRQHVNTPRYAKDAATKQYVDDVFDQVKPGASSSVFDYRCDATSTGPSDPGAGKYRYSASPQSAAETLYMDWLTQDGFDVVALFTTMKFGDEFIIQDKDLSVNYQKWKLLGPAQIMPDWFQIPVQFIEGDAVFTNNQLVSFVVTFVGQEGEPGPMGPPGPTGSQGPKGDTGPGVPPSGNAGQVLSKIDGVDYNTQWTTPSTGDVTKSYVDTQDALKVSKTGDTMTGDLAITKAAPYISLNKTGDTGGAIWGKRNGLNRWIMTIGAGDPETGGNVGSGFYLTSCDDAGNIIKDLLAVSRADGSFRFSGNMQVWKDAPNIYLNKTGDPGSAITSQRNGANRWMINLANAVDDFVINRYDDGGASSQVLYISRTTGLGTVLGNPTAPLGIATKGYVDSAVAAGGGGSYVAKTGDIMTGQLNINYNAPVISLNKSDPTVGNSVNGTTNGAARWSMRLGDYGAESGANAGSDFSIHRFADNGITYLGNALSISRATGNASFSGTVNSANGRLWGTSDFGNPATTFLPLAGGQMTGRIGLSGYGLHITQVSDITLRVNSGFYENSATSLALGWPTASGWCHLIAATHSNDANYYSMQLAMSFAGSSQQLYFRNTDGNGATGWRTVWDNASINKGNLGLVTYFNDGPGSGAWYSVPSISNNRFYVGTEGAGDTWRIYSTGGGNIMVFHGYDNTVSMPGWLQVGGVDCGGNAWVKGGVLYMSSGGHYFQWDGGNYQMPHGGLIIQGNWAARQNTDNTFNNITCNGAVDATNMYYGRLGQGGARSNTFSIYWDGRAWCMIDSSNMGQFSGVSDYRAKKDVENMKSMWDDIKKLRPISFKFNDWTPEWEEKTQRERAEQEGREVRPFIVGSNMTEWGFIAHELQEALIPTVASGYKDIQKAVQVPNPLPLIAMTVKALQEAIIRIELLEGKLQ
jgi:hypothetical protein